MCVCVICIFLWVIHTNKLQGIELYNILFYHNYSLYSIITTSNNKLLQKDYT